MMNARMLIFLVSLLLCSCTGHNSGQTGIASQGTLRTMSNGQFEFMGKDYWQAQNERYLVDQSVELNGETGLAYALYSFGGFAPITDLDSIVVRLGAIQSPQSGAYYVGLADHDSHGWKWFETQEYGVELAIGEADNFVSEEGVLHLAVVMDSSSVGKVKSLDLVGDSQPEWVEESVQAVAGIHEPSGICLNPDNTSMFIVDDGTLDDPSGVAEVDFAFNLIRRIDLGVDLEGICYCTVDDLLYVVDEVAELVYMVEPNSLMVVGSFYYSREFGGNEVIAPGGDGVEGITFVQDVSVVGGGYFLLLNQNDPTAVLRIDKGDINSNPPGNPAPLSGFTLVEQRTAGALYYNESKRQLWVVHSWMEFVEVYNIDTMQFISRDNFPGFAQEGATLGPEGELWVCDDTGYLGKYIYKVE